MDSFSKHLEQYNDNEVETVMQTIMKQLAATLSWQRVIPYEFGPEYEEYSEYSEKKLGFLGRLTLNPCQKSLLKSR